MKKICKYYEVLLHIIKFQAKIGTTLLIYRLFKLKHDLRCITFLQINLLHKW